MTSKELFEYYQSEGMSKHQFKTELEHPFHRKRYAITRGVMDTYAKGTLLDIGCAEGYLARWSLNYADFAVGVDLSAPKVKRAMQEVRDHRIEFLIASFDSLPFRKETFGTVIWSEGPEHAVNPEDVFREIAVLLKNNGSLITSTMGLEPPVWYRFLRRVLGEWKKEVEEWQRWGHVTTFTRESLLRLISQHFTVETNFSLRPLILFPIRRIQKFFDSFVQKLTGRYVGSAWPGFGCMVIVARKSDNLQNSSFK